jgi:hypothetical protein
LARWVHAIKSDVMPGCQPRFTVQVFCLNMPGPLLTDVLGPFNPEIRSSEKRRYIKNYVVAC